MKDIEQVIDGLLAKRPGGFRNKHLAEALGVSSARAGQLLSPRVLSGELATRDEGRRLYIRGPERRQAAAGIARGAIPGGFWRALVEDYPRLAYVSLGGLSMTSLRTRQQVRTALLGVAVSQRFLVIDLEGVNSISPSACHELFVEVPRRESLQVEPINLEPGIARIIWRTVRLSD